jgi:hypothetical protein
MVAQELDLEHGRINLLSGLSSVERLRGNADGALRLATLSARLDLKAKRAAAATWPALAALAARRDEIPEGSRTIVERLVKKRLLVADRRSGYELDGSHRVHLGRTKRQGADGRARARGSGHVGGHQPGPGADRDILS